MSEEIPEKAEPKRAKSYSRTRSAKRPGTNAKMAERMKTPEWAEHMRKMREKRMQNIREGKTRQGRRKGIPDGFRRGRGQKLYLAAKEKARAVAEKALAHVAEQYVKEGKVDKAILGNVILIEAAEIALMRHPDTGKHVYSTRDRLQACALLAPYILEKPEVKVAHRADTVESVLLEMAGESPVIEHDPSV